MTINNNVKMAKVKANVIGQIVSSVKKADLETRIAGLNQEDRKAVSCALGILEDKKNANKYVQEMQRLTSERIQTINSTFTQDAKGEANHEPGMFSFSGIKKEDLAKQVLSAKTKLDKKAKARQEEKEKLHARLAEETAQVTLLKNKANTCKQILAAVRRGKNRIERTGTYTQVIGPYCVKGTIGRTVLEESIPNISTRMDFPTPDEFLSLVQAKNTQYNNELQRIQQSLNLLQGERNKDITKLQRLEKDMETLQKGLNKVNLETKATTRGTWFQKNVFYQLLRAASTNQDRKPLIENELRFINEEIDAKTAMITEENENELPNNLEINEIGEQIKHAEDFKKNIDLLSKMLLLCESGKNSSADFINLLNRQQEAVAKKMQEVVQRKERYKSEIQEIKIRKSALEGKGQISSEIEEEEEERLKPRSDKTQIEDAKEDIKEILTSLKMLQTSLENVKLKTLFKEEKDLLLSKIKTASLKNKIAVELDIFEACLAFPAKYPVKGTLLKGGLPSEIKTMIKTWEARCADPDTFLSELQQQNKEVFARNVAGQHFQTGSNTIVKQEILK
jgi:hypothetical protein